MKPELPRDADRQTVAALILLAAARPQAVADLLRETALADRVEGAEERAAFLERVALWLAPHRFSLWRSARMILSGFGGAWRAAALETDLELEARELEEKAARPDSTGSRRGRVALGPLVVLGLLVVAVFMLATAGAGDELLVRWIAAGLVVTCGALAMLDLTLAHWRARRARAELEALEPEPLPRPVVAPRSSGLVLWFEHEDGNADRLLDVRDLEPNERVRIVLETSSSSYVDPSEKAWFTLAAWRVLANGRLEREERNA